MQTQHIGNESDSPPKVATRQQIEFLTFTLSGCTSFHPPFHLLRIIVVTWNETHAYMRCENASAKAAQIDFAGTMRLSLQ